MNNASEIFAKKLNLTEKIKKTYTKTNNSSVNKA